MNEPKLTIEKFLADTPSLRPLEILIPENCALCLDHNNATVHVCIEEDGSVIIEEI